MVLVIIINVIIVNRVRYHFPLQSADPRCNSDINHMEIISCRYNCVGLIICSHVICMFRSPLLVVVHQDGQTGARLPPAWSHSRLEGAAAKSSSREENLSPKWLSYKQTILLADSGFNQWLFGDEFLLRHWLKIPFGDMTWTLGNNPSCRFLNVTSVR